MSARLSNPCTNVLDKWGRVILHGDEERIRLSIRQPLTVHDQVNTVVDLRFRGTKFMMVMCCVISRRSSYDDLEAFIIPVDWSAGHATCGLIGFESIPGSNCGSFRPSLIRPRDILEFL